MPDLRIEAVRGYLEAGISFNTALGKLFADEATLPHLRKDAFDFLEKNLRHLRIEIDRALLVLEERRIGIVGSFITANADPGSDLVKARSRRAKRTHRSRTDAWFGQAPTETLQVKKGP